MERSDPHRDWGLFRTRAEQGGNQPAFDEDLVPAVRNAWPHVLGHVGSELFEKAPGSESTAAQVWESVPRSVAKTPLRGGDHRPSIADLEFYLIAVFHHRFNRLFRHEQPRAETFELFPSVVKLEQFEAAADVEWAERLERATAIKQIVGRMDHGRGGLAGEIVRRPIRPHMPPTQIGTCTSQGLNGVHRPASVRKQERFTALLHNLSVALVHDDFYALRRQAPQESMA